MVIRTRYAAVNPADWKARAGKLKLITGRRFPKILGIEGSGVVEVTGGGVSSFTKGQHVYAARNYTTGTYAEYFKVPEKNVLVLPDTMSLKDAASIGVTGVTAYQCLVRHGRLEEGMKVLVNGASGGVGIMAVQIARMLGAEVTGVCSERNMDFVKSLGAGKVIDYNRTRITDMEIQYDIIIDAAGNLDLSGSGRILAPRGRLIKLNLSLKTFREQVRTGLFGRKKVKLVLLKMVKEDFRWVRDQIAMGNLKVVIDRVYPLKDCREAHEYSESLRARGKVLLEA